jgi:transposase-like protein
MPFSYNNFRQQKLRRKNMTQEKENNLLARLMQMVNDNGTEAVAEIFRILLNEAMKIERDQTLGAGLYERTDDRQGYANGYKPKTVDTRMGRLMVSVPQVRGNVQFYPSALEKGCRSERALKLAIAEMYVKGISTRRVTDVLEKMCGLSVSGTQVSRVAAILDEELQKWRNRPLGEYPYLVFDAHYEKVRTGGSVLAVAVLTAVGVDAQCRRCVLGVSVSLSEAETHWREFIKGLQDRGLTGVRYIVSDDHDGLKAAMAARMTGVLWQRCQCHLQRNAAAYVPRAAMRRQVHNDIRDIFNAPDRTSAEERLKFYVAKYEKTAAKLSVWMEENLPEGLAVFALPEGHRKRMRTTNMLERVHKELNRRTRVAGLFPNEASLLRLVSAVLMELDEEWQTGKRYFNMNVENDEPALQANKIYRKNVA